MTAAEGSVPSGRPRYLDVVRDLAAAQKAKAAGAPPYSIHVNRPAGRLIAAAAFRAGLTPNAVTAISAVFTFSGIALIAFVPPTWWLGVLTWLLLAVGYAFDSADGQLARLRGGGSFAGEWLDHVIDCVKISSLHLAVLITAYLHFGLPSAALLLVPLVFAIIAAAEFFTMILNDQLKRVAAAGTRTPPATSGGRRSLLRSVLLAPTDYGILCLIFLTLGAPPVFFVIYSLMFLGNLGHFALALVKWFGDMRALDAAKSAEARSAR
ncbi:CDP-alcohol phosphatidyltransferase family protein [Leifsonia sp. LS-T14]|uniref:CDP-alcohol phosphatidyltransferase family protein n=1 Tax=unclassified Leifsonia TaxID=2663824 RepID=UPI0035A680A0